MGKKKIEVDCCDFCNETENLNTCDACGKMMCIEHEVDEDWHIPDTPLCENCHTKVWKNMQDYIKSEKEKSEQ